MSRFGRVQQKSFFAMLADHFNECAEAAGDCLGCEYSPLRGFVIVSPGFEVGEEAEQRRSVSRAEVFAEIARMEAEILADQTRRAAVNAVAQSLAVEG